MAKSASLPKLTIKRLCAEAAAFAAVESTFPEPSLYGVDNGKAVGTYLEHKFQAYLKTRYLFAPCNSAMGVDFPDLQVDMKVTSVTQPQSSCPFKSARQKIFGLGYAVLVFVYEKTDDPTTTSATLSILHTVFIDARRTGDYQMTRLLRELLDNGANTEELIALMRDRNLWVDDVEALNIAEELLKNKPEQGYLTVSNALQWRLQYGRVIAEAGKVDGILKLK
jgi:hypothetical protein